MRFVKSIIAVVVFAALSCCYSVAQGLLGDWNGRIEISSGRSLPIEFHLVDADGKTKATMDSPDQNALDITAFVKYLSDDSVRLTVPKIRAAYAARLEDGELHGIFTQGGVKLPLVLKRGLRQVNRPQTPVPPFPYKEETVRIENAEGKSVLSGTLALPGTMTDDTPVVVMVSGSGLQDRDESLFDHRPFAVIADYLARNGIASVRYDDRGFGESTGDVSRATTADFASDAAAVVNWIRSSGRFGKTGVIGHSEGGTIAYRLASEKLPDFIVSMAGPAVRGDSIIVWQNRYALAHSGVDGKTIDDFCEAYQRAFEYWFKDKDSPLDDETLGKIYPDWNRDETTRMLAQGIKKLFTATHRNPWWDWFVEYSPAGAMKGISCPALLIFGELDCQVPPAICEMPARMLAKDAVIKVYPGLNHLLQHAVTGSVDEYSQIEETISPDVLSDIVTFIKGL